MARAVQQRHSVRTTVSSCLLVVAAVIVLALAPSAQATSRAHAAVTTITVAYSLSGQVGGTPLQGWLNGTQDSTGLLTATVTIADPVTDAPVTANANGRIVGKGSSAAVLIAVTPMAGSTMAMGNGATMTMAGGPVGKAGQWAGAIIQGSATVGAWLLTPQTSNLHIDFGGKSGAASKDKVAVSGALNLGVTASGWATGTYASFDGSITYVVQGWVNGGDVAVTVPWGKAGAVSLVGTQGKLKLTHPSWSGNFIGPAPGDLGTWIGQA
jgi:hypothetical protein